VGDPSSLPYRPRNGYYYTHSWYQAIQTIGIPPRLHNNTVSIDSYFLVTFARNTQVRIPDQNQHFSSTSTIYDIQTWISEVLGTIYEAPVVYPETQLHFLAHDPVLASTNLSNLITTGAVISLHVVSKSPLVHPDESEVTRIFFGQYTLQPCTNFLNGREQVNFFDRREQLGSNSVRISQADISPTVPFRFRSPGFDTDRPNFHAYVIRFCPVLPTSHPSSQRYSGFEYLEFNNARGLRHIRWLISQNTAINPSKIQFYSTTRRELHHPINSSRTLRKLCDIFAHTRDDHVTVVTEPSRGMRSPLGIITVERVGTLRPQMQPPYLSGNVRFVESYADFDQNGIYSDNLIPQIPSMLTTVFEIALYLPFMTDIITKDIMGNSTISEIMSWTSAILAQ
jgi:hypothetical protein